LAVRDVSKAFRLPHEQVHTLKERVLHPFRTRSEETLDALSAVSTDIRSGEFFGIVGRNGSGKTTLMKCLAGIYRPDTGEIWARGRVAPFIELGVGFNPDLTARDNVLINAVMLGLSPSQARERYDSIIEFAELERFTELKLKNYSSGMQVRLAFAVMVHVDADLLLIDEVLAVGDSAFQRKCLDSLMKARAEGRTILLVTHDMNSVQRFCDRAMLLDGGDLITIGDPREVSRRYEELNMARYGRSDGPAIAHAGDGSAAIVDCWLEDETGERAEQIPHGRPTRIRMEVEWRVTAEGPNFGFMISDERGRGVLALASESTIRDTGTFKAGENVTVDVALDCLLAGGSYSVSPEVRHGTAERRLMDHRENAASFEVVGMAPSGGIVELPHEMSFSRSAAVERAGS
jgi:ABC-type polysaccharide/polyol phosphate transport system ATPase subunit